MSSDNMELKADFLINRDLAKLAGPRVLTSWQSLYGEGACLWRPEEVTHHDLSQAAF